MFLLIVLIDERFCMISYQKTFFLLTFLVSNLFSHDVLKIGLPIVQTGPNSGVADVDSNGKLHGFDVELFCQIAKILGKKIHFYETTTVGFEEQLTSGKLDMVGATSQYITNRRLQNMSAVDVDVFLPANVGSYAIIFPSSVAPYATIEELIAANPSAKIGSSSIGALTYEALLEFGVPAANIVNILPFEGSLNTAAGILEVFAETGVDAMFIYPCATAQNIIGSAAGLSISCESLPSDLVPQGAGIFFDRTNCKLALEVQAALNTIVIEGTYATILHNVMNDPFYTKSPDGNLVPFLFAGSGMNYLVAQPYANYSLELVANVTDGTAQTFIPANCRIEQTYLSPKYPTLRGTIRTKYNGATSCNNYTYTPLVTA